MFESLGSMDHCDSKHVAVSKPNTPTWKDTHAIQCCMVHLIFVVPFPGVFWDTLEAIDAVFVGSDAVIQALCSVFDAVIHSAKSRSLDVVPPIFRALLAIMERAPTEAFMLAPFTTALEYHGQLAPRASEGGSAGSGGPPHNNDDVLAYFGRAFDLAFERLGLSEPDFSRDSAAFGAFLDFGTRMIIFR